MYYVGTGLDLIYDTHLNSLSITKISHYFVDSFSIRGLYYYKVRKCLNINIDVVVVFSLATAVLNRHQMAHIHMLAQYRRNRLKLKENPTQYQFTTTKLLSVIVQLCTLQCAKVKHLNNWTPSYIRTIIQFVIQI